MPSICASDPTQISEYAEIVQRVVNMAREFNDGDPSGIEVARAMGNMGLDVLENYDLYEDAVNYFDALLERELFGG